MKVLKPAVLVLRTAGFLFVTFLLSTLLACMMGREASELPNGLQVTEGSVNSQMLAGCGDFCSQMYGTPSACDEEQLSDDQILCELVCDRLSKSVPDQCEALFIDFYDCVIDEDITYECEGGESSPTATESTCEELYSQANDCLSVSTTG